MSYLCNITRFHEQVNDDPDDHCAEETFPSVDESAEADAEEGVQEGVEAGIDGRIMSMTVSTPSYTGRPKDWDWSGLFGGRR